MNRKATAAVLGAGSLWGIISIFVRQLNAMGLTALQLGGGRVLIGAVILFLWLGLAHRELLKIRLRDLWYFIGTGIISLALFNSVSYTHLDVYKRQAYYSPMLFRDNGTYYTKGYAPVNVAMVTVTPMDKHGFFKMCIRDR